MKKLFTIALAAAMMFAAAGHAQAATLETAGEYRARYWMLGNYLTNTETSEFWDQRLRLNGVWQLAEGVKLQFRADILEGFWGDQIVTATTVDGKTTFGPAKNSRDQIAFDWVNLAFTLPNTPVTITVGRQDASWGPGVFVKSDNRDRFKITGKWGDTIALYTYDKYTEIVALHGIGELDDRRQHSAGVISKLGGWNVGLIYAGIFNNTDPNVDSLIHGPDVYAMGKLGPVDVKFEGFWVMGQEDKTVGLDVDNDGKAIYLGLSMPVSNMVIGAEGIWVPGDDPTTLDKNEGVGKQDYQGPFNSVILFNNYDYQGYDTAGLYANDQSVANAFAGKLYIAGKFPGMDKLSYYGSVVYAVRDQVAAGKDDQMGTEFDLLATYGITENVSFTFGGGYLAAGDFYGDVDDPWALTGHFTSKF